MVITQLMGGLGNQLFQYATGRALSLKLDQPLYVDTEIYRHHSGEMTPREYMLDDYAIKAEIATAKELRRFQSSLPYLNSVLRLSGLTPLFFPGIVTEKGRFYDSEILNHKGNIYLKGYWQSPHYFEGIRNQLLEELRLVIPLSPQAKAAIVEIEKYDSIMLHVRRGDYISNIKANQHHGVCPPEYYTQALNTLVPKLKNPKVFVFSDDIAWCKNNLQIPVASQFFNFSATEDLEVMRTCQHFIIANSSFSWWGAWLSTNSHKQVIAPKQWLVSAERDDLVPAEWIRL